MGTFSLKITFNGSINSFKNITQILYTGQRVYFAIKYKNKMYYL